ncbi:MAG: hypothetical protein QF858_01880 [Candidatus Pacebacteria bacterium]|jgi:tetratricopeptide (TPR) repeat protein|nr:hypothetical protein [bacterium]MDP6527608.1 hypothetical protein [Candidatus Paceibacterota bacterium]MDP6659540.1 hypothetical protein [Candidatus Paceibacterota bacterium]|tara:strand:- start:7515 stop:8339 length:825 start_codon:yes stop_codon:yes gene_type:complete
MSYAIRSVIILGAVGVFAIGYFILSDKPGVNDESLDSATTTEVTVRDSDDISSGASVDVISDTDLGSIPLVTLVEDTSVPHPDIEREAIYNSPFEELKVLMAPKFSETRESLRKEPYSIFDWLELAIHYKTIDDFDGAEEIWIYLTKASPNNSVAFNNLGDLYHYYRHDFPQAEEYMLKTLERASDPSYFVNLFTLYKISYKTETNLAEETLLNGLKKNKDDLNLLMELARYYEEKGENTKSLELYKEARPHAQLAGNTSLVDAIDQAIVRLDR